MFRPTSIDDKIVFTRAILGIVFGFIAYLLYRLNVVLFMDVSATIWIFAGILYIASVFYVQKKYMVKRMFLLFLRGILTYYTIWIAEFLILYDLLG